MAIYSIMSFNNLSLNEISDKSMVLPEFKDHNVYSAWNYGAKGGRRKKTYKRGKIGKGRRTRNRRVQKAKR